MSDRSFQESDAYREAPRPTLPSVRELFPELSRTPRPSVIHPSSWAGSNASHDSYSTPHMGQSDGVLSGPGLQRHPSTSYHPISRGSRHETHATHLHPTHEHPPHSLYHSQHPPNQYSRPSTDNVQGRPAYDYTNHPGPSSYLDYSRQHYPGQMIEPSGSTPYAPRYPDVRAQHYRRDSQETASSLEDSVPPANTSSLKYECDYCGKGFTRPSSLKIHLNSHTGEKPFTCTFEGCGRSFSVLSNMRRHARVHADASGRYHEESSDESNDAHSRSGR
ncbi:uncharacterized protein EDB91DRAFT_583787 [Suillus paluster]|uniref:uncharacterized protein n=1 Tax=Suillus paluster TaxID=48578 RepID=UPI001B880910|nr:uncharacterized protein EDB91DRAFT_583787 [Suillus paluster]KAG1734709.1 hypothetical protein EDB91DRAFT_583787 [Suillus paluster]